MRYYWGFGVGHTYAHGQRDLVQVGDTSGENDDDDAEVSDSERHEAQEPAINVLDLNSCVPSVAESEPEDSASGLSNASEDEEDFESEEEM